MINTPQAAAWSFALAISASPIFILIYGPLGLRGTGILTVSFLCLAVAGVAVFGSVRNFRLSVLDVALLVLVICAATSFALNPFVADMREIILLAITLSAYFAGRLFTRDHIPILRRVCFRLSAFIVVIGTAATVPFLVSNWMAGELGRPFIFGFDNAATAFSISLGVLVMAFLTSSPVSSRLVPITIAMIAISTVVLAASTVRFSLLAILASVALCIVLSTRERKFALTLLVVLVASIGTGWVAGSANTKLYAAYTLEELAGGSVSTQLKSWYSSEKPSYEAERNPLSNSPGCESVNTRNSVAIRRQLFSDALDLVPRAGLVGFGFMSFGQLACFRGVSPHNDLLQVTIEFGWLGGAAFSVIILAPMLLLFRPARSDNDMRFLFLLCGFMVMLAMVYGQIARESSLFMTLGMAVGVLSAKRTSINKHQELLQGSQISAYLG